MTRATAPEQTDKARPAQHRRWRRVALIVAALVALMVAGGVLVTRYGPMSPQGRLMVEARTDGLKLGRFGRLKVEGFSGDLWRDFNIDRLTLSDEKGVWLEAREVDVTWDYVQLLRRRFVADSIRAEHVTVLRRPVLSAKTKSQGLPVSIDVDRFAARVELLPAFSYERGVYDVKGAVRMGRRNGGQSGELHAESFLHPGDRLNLKFNLGGGKPLLVDLDAREARGGALAGALGLPADQPFLLTVKADGDKAGGAFTALAKSGEAQPLAAKGRWDRSGARAAGELALTASELTKPLVDALGPVVRFELVANRDQQNLYATDLRLQSREMQIALAGLVDPHSRRTGPQGVQVTAELADAPAALPGPDVGAAQFNGRVTGGLQSPRLAGQLLARDVVAGGLGLARIAGPVEITSRAGRIDFDADLKGSGGRGEALLADLLGSSPALSVEGARLANGQLMIESLRASGANLSVQAQGGRSLTGRLNFSGEARLTDISSIRPDASGSAAFDWRAVQAGADAPWRLTVDGRGRSLSTGFAALDQLLGATPRLRAEARLLDGGRFAVEEATLSGTRLRADAAGVIGGPQGVRVKLDWRAHGPLAVGPVELTGAATGRGAITGSLSAPKLDLIADVEKVDLPRLPLSDVHLVLSLAHRGAGRSGVVSVRADTPYGPARGRTELALPPGALRLENLRVEAGGLSAAGNLSVRNGSPSQADLRVQLGPGAFLERGKVSGAVQIAGSPRSARAALNLTAENAVLRGSDVVIGQGRLVAQGPLERLPYEVDVRGRSDRGAWTAQGRGLLTRDDGAMAATFAGSGSLAGETLRTVRPVIVKFAGEERSLDLLLATARGGQVAAQGRLDPKTASLQAQLTNISLAMVNQDLAGRANAVVNLSGRGDRLTGTLDARLADARAQGSKPELGIDAHVRGTLGDDIIDLQATAANEQGLRASAHLHLAAKASASPLGLAINRQRPMGGEFSATGEIEPLWDLLVGGERSLSGRAAVSGRIAGSLTDPQVRGQASVDGGHFVDGATGLVLQQATLRASFTDDGVEVSRLRGVDGEGGTLTAQGRISLLRNGASSFRLTLQEFQLIDTDAATASVSGEAKVDRTGDGKLKISGALVVTEAEVSPSALGPPGVVTLDVVEINRPAGLRQSAVPPRGKPRAPIALDVTLDAPRRVFVRGRGLDVELSLDGRIGGTTADPTLSGTARLVRGDYTFAGKRFVFDERGVVYLATDPENIRIDLTARREDPTLTAVIRIRGTAARPDISLSSTPALPEDEVLSHVLFGRSASQLSTIEAARLAAALASLSGGGGFDLLANLRELTGLDRLAFVGGEGSGLAVAGGRYISDDVYLEIIGGGRDGPAVQVEWRLSKRLSVFSRLAGQGGADIAIRWRRDY